MDVTALLMKTKALISTTARYFCNRILCFWFKIIFCKKKKKNRAEKLATEKIWNWMVLDMEERQDCNPTKAFDRFHEKVTPIEVGRRDGASYIFKGNQNKN